MPVRHHRRKTPVTILAVSIGLALQLGAAAHAQETEPSADADAQENVDTTLDTISVTGYRASLERALDIKRGEIGRADV